MRISEEDFRKIKRKIIRTMYSLNKWEANHILIKNLESGFPKHEMKKVKGVIIRLIKEGLLKIKPTLHGKAVSLSIKKKDKMEEIKNKSAIF